MRDFRDDYEMDEHGKLRKRKRVARDGERITFPMTAMDAMHARAGFSPTFADGTPDYTSPFRPGHRFADINDEARIAADAAYEERRQRMHYGNRYRQRDDAQANAAPPRRTLADLQQSAATAYEAMCERMRNAWRHD